MTVMADVRENPAQHRYEIYEDGTLVGIADYMPVGDQVIFPHTEIDRACRGRGLGEQLVRAALDDVRAKGLSVVPQCWFVREFIDDNAEYRDLVA
jgi:predicted GNAT family acetyltransferase